MEYSSLRKVRLNSGGYEYGKHGRYFGRTEQPVYRFDSVSTGDTRYYRGFREDVEKQVRREFPADKVLSTHLPPF